MWLANADGSGQYQVTLDGTAGSPYSSPSQADDGTIVALRTPFGGRPQIWRMHQNGGLLNAPINTPAPGTGAIDARVSPDGQLVAYWFLTEVSTGTCLYCFEISSRALISYARPASRIPTRLARRTPAAWPSWMSNNRCTVGRERGELVLQARDARGGPVVGRQRELRHVHRTAPDRQPQRRRGESGRSADRSRPRRQQGDDRAVQSGGPPPADGSAPPPTPECAFTGANGGKFVRPTWSQDGKTLAWQEGNGIWSSRIPDISNCAALTSQLIVPGGTDPDFGPDRRQPGRATGLRQPRATRPRARKSRRRPILVSLGHRLGSLLASCAGALRRMAIHGLLRKHKLTLAFEAPRARDADARADHDR